jgi:predicted HTH transcriptional regulator
MTSALFFCAYKRRTSFDRRPDHRMAMDADVVRELAARHEGPSLDFKREQYQWTSGGNRELAKDIMAIATGLASHNAPGYILIGVDEAPDGTGRIVGVSSEGHLDDAEMHSKVTPLLNRTPHFAYLESRSFGDASAGVVKE